MTAIAPVEVAHPLRGFLHLRGKPHRAATSRRRFADEDVARRALAIDGQGSFASDGTLTLEQLARITFG